MAALLRERLRRDLKPLDDQGAGHDVSSVLWNWLNNPEWVAAARRFPPERRRLLLAELGQELYERNLAGYADRIRAAAEHLNFIWPEEARRTMLRRHCEALLAELSDRVSFCNPAETSLLVEETTFLGAQHIRAAQESAGGIIFLSVHQSHPSFGFKHPTVAPLKVVGISHDTEVGNARAALLLRGVADAIDVLPASRGSVRDVLRTLAAGNCLAIYNDFVYPESRGIASPLFGRPVLISRSALAIALKTKASVLPVAIARQWPLDCGGVRCEIFPPLPLEDLDRGDPRSLPTAALRFGVATECLIRLYPAQWRLWDTLGGRWRAAESSASPIASRV